MSAMIQDEAPRRDVDCFRGENAFLSNFYPTKVWFDGVAYYSSEAAYQAQKCPHLTNREQFARLSADEAKRLGSKVEVRPDWDDIKLAVMERVVYEKFAQNPTLAQDLLDTGDRALKEGNTWGDLYWGVDIRTGEGENHLGKVLMSLRDELRRNGIPAAQPAGATLAGPFHGIWLDDRDITLSGCECIVNATNKTLLSAGGPDGAIFRAGGPGLREACAALGGCRVGEAKLTGGYRLQAKYVIHTVGPRYPAEHCCEDLARCYTACLDLAGEQGVGSIAFPSISTGRSSYPVKEACEIAVSSVRTWLAENGGHDIKVVFSCVDPKIYDAFYSILTAECPGAAQEKPCPAAGPLI